MHVCRTDAEITGYGLETLANVMAVETSMRVFYNMYTKCNTMVWEKFAVENLTHEIFLSLNK